MAVITIPSGLKVMEQGGGQRRFDLTFGGGDAGAQQARLLGPPRWLATLAAPDGLTPAEAAVWRRVILALDGQVNHLAIYDLLQTAPRGTARGTWTANGGAAAGATSIAISAGVGQAGTTILEGDWFGVNQSGTNRQVLSVAADVTLDGSGDGTLTFKPALRVAVANASSIVWDKPTFLAKQTGQESSWIARRARQSGFVLDLMESWE